MSLNRIHLRKLLKIYYADNSERTATLRDDIRQDIKRQAGIKSSGGDFHGPFWADVKSHVGGRLDLTNQVRARIASNERRERLYQQLMEGFLNWWNERRRWRNERFALSSDNPSGQLSVPELNTVVKVENLMAIDVDGHQKRVVYPYFSEQPVLPDEGGRLGLWVLAQALPMYRLEDLRVLDVLRGKSFSTMDCPLLGDEQVLFLRNYRQALDAWSLLRQEYD